MTRPLLLDLFCKQGGAAKGYVDAGFDVIGVDIEPQPRYPFEFVQADALDYFTANWQRFDAFHASPPCQAHSNAQKIMGLEHPDFIDPMRALFMEAWYAPQGGQPWVIENVPGAPLMAPIERVPGVPARRAADWTRTVGGGMCLARTWRRFGLRPIFVVLTAGNFSGVAQAKAAMGIDWMNRDGLREAIPPAYTEYIGTQLIEALKLKDAA